jgi:septal ring factor EnvC (AmiA/AmiB activator)
MGRAVFIISSLALLLTATPSFASVSEQLQGIKKEIREKKLLLKKTRRVENRVSNELENINENLRAKEAALSLLMGDLRVVEKSLETTRAEIDKVRDDADRKKKQITERISALYRAGDVGSAQAFFSSGSIPRLMENRRYMKAVLDYDKGLFSAYNERIDLLRKLKTSLETDMARKERIRADIEEKKQEIEEQKREKTAYLGKLREDKKKNLASLKELEANARRLQRMVERLEAKARKRYTPKENKKALSGGSLSGVPARGFGALKGKLSIPARGEIIEGFGRHKHPDFNSYTVSNGISIAAARGSEVRSVYDGQVIFADYFKGYGNMVIVDHGGGFFSLYAHTLRILKKVGANVEKNEVIASVGDVDSAKGPMLYFEIRYQGRPVDPTSWFR